MAGTATLDIILTMLKNCEPHQDTTSARPYLVIPEKNGGRTLWSAKYLLGQILRQVDVPSERKHLSVQAAKKWKELGLEEQNIWRYHYQDWITCRAPIIIERYTGASSEAEPVDLKKKGGFVFRSVFHDEHIVPINDVLDVFLSIPKEELTHERIAEQLDKIHICRMLKSENFQIRPRYGRGCDQDCKQIYEKYYKPSNVIIPDFEK